MTGRDRPRYWVGTSGYNYPEWKGSFYPERIAGAQMLPYYARHFPTVEINSTFYRMPTERTVAGWAAATPPTFRLTLKAPRRITHDGRLQQVGALVDRFVQVAQTLEEKLGVLLFQLPPSFRRDLSVFDAFLEGLPRGLQAAFEFRHPSWHDEEVFGRLRARGLALCVAESEHLSTPVVITAEYAYFRLRDEGYTPTDLARWAEVIADRAGRCRDVYVYFKHEAQGTGPAFARQLMAELGVRADG